MLMKKIIRESLKWKTFWQAKKTLCILYHLLKENI